jgi:hypothetical protein
MFFIKDFNFNEYLGENKIASIRIVSNRNSEVQYLWNGFVILKGAELPDKNHFDYRLGKVLNTRTDTGGRTYWWLKRNPDIKLKWIKSTKFLNDESIAILPQAIQDIYENDYAFQFIEDAILHYRAGSNWQKKPVDFVNSKKICFEKLMDEILYNNQIISIKPEFYFE